jgi:hypothetical protein
MTCQKMHLTSPRPARLAGQLLMAALKNTKMARFQSAVNTDEEELEEDDELLPPSR